MGPIRSVLVVEDEEGVRDLAVESLQRHGYHVITAASGKPAPKVFDRVRMSGVMPSGP